MLVKRFTDEPAIELPIVKTKQQPPYEALLTTACKTVPLRFRPEAIQRVIKFIIDQEYARGFADRDRLDSRLEQPLNYEEKFELLVYHMGEVDRLRCMKA